MEARAQTDDWRYVHVGDLCFVCWMGTAACPKCGNRVLGGLCDICSMVEQRETMILSSSAGKFMSEHGTGPFERASRSKKAKVDSGVKEPKKAPRHIVRSKTPNKSRKKKDG